jgi:hypothetical protein
MAIQSQEDILRTADDWFRNFCPSNLVKDGLSGTKNAELIMGRCLQKHGVLTISGMTEAAHELGPEGKLVLIPEPPAPKVKTADELAAAEIAKQHRDYMDSIRPQESFDAKVARDKQKRQAAEAAKAQTDAKDALAVAISGYQCYRLNGAGIDYVATETVQRELRTVKCGNDAIRTLAVVRQIIQELPDHPKMGDVARVVGSLNARRVK